MRWAALEPRVRPVVALAPYAELAAAARCARREYARFIPEACVQAGLNKLPALLHVEPEDLDPVTILRRHPVKALFVVGEGDRITPVSEVKRLWEAAAAQSRLLVVPRATHEALPFFFTDLDGPVTAWLEAGSRANPHANPAVGR